MREPLVILNYAFEAHSWIDGTALTKDVLTEVRPWLRENLPNTRVWVSWGRGEVKLSFVSEQDAVHFRMMWG